MHVVWRLQDAAEGALRARTAFCDWLRTCPQPPCDPETAGLIYGELVSNTVRYANGPVDIRLEASPDGAVLQVRDHGPGFDGDHVELPRDLYAENGRGLAIVATLALWLVIAPADGGGMLVRALLPAGTS